MINRLLICLNLRSDINKLLLMHFDEFQVLLCDVIVVLLHLLESFLVVFHQVIDVLILTLLDLVHLHLHAEFKFLLQLVRLRLVVLDQLLLCCVQTQL